METTPQKLYEERRATYSIKRGKGMWRNHLFLGQMDGLACYSLISRKQVFFLPQKGPIWSVLQVGRLLFLAGKEPKIFAWDTGLCREVFRLEGHTMHVRSLESWKMETNEETFVLILCLKRIQIRVQPPLLRHLRHLMRREMLISASVDWLILHFCFCSCQVFFQSYFSFFLLSKEVCSLSEMFEI